jgi:hypothetical protein
MSSTTIELHPLSPPASIIADTLPDVDADLTTPLSRTQSTSTSIPPADGGKDAWLFLAACFMVEALVWGFPFAFGVFQEFYSRRDGEFKGEGAVAVIGTCAMVSFEWILAWRFDLVPVGGVEREFSKAIRI